MGSFSIVLGIGFCLLAMFWIGRFCVRFYCNLKELKNYSGLLSAKDFLNYHKGKNG